MDAQWRSRKPEQVLAILMAPGPRAVECRKNSLDSLRKYSELRKDDAESIEYRYAQVAALIVGGKFIDAEKLCDALLGEVQTDERIWLLKAAAQIARMNFKGGSVTLTRLIDDVAPSLWRPYFFRGWISLVAKDWDRAIADCTRSVELDARQARVYALRAAAYLEKGDVMSANKDYDLAITYAPAWGFVLTARAGTRLRLGDPRGAVQDAARAMEVEPTDWTAPFVRAQAKWRLGDRVGAMADAGRAIKNAPRESEPYALRSQLRHAAGEKDGALEDATKVTQLAPGELSSWRWRASLRWLSKDVPGAIEDLGHALEIAPDDLNLRVTRGQYRLDSGDPAGAVEDATKAIELAPKDGKHRLLRGKALMAQKGFRKALEDLQKAVELTPGLVTETKPLVAQCRKALAE
jgi:tetratricopeptide (TPR) repeat protein